MTSWIRRQFRDGVSVADYIPGGLSSGATTFTAHDGSTFPDGSVGNFIITVNQGLSDEEKVLIATRSGSTFTVAASGRGYGTGGSAAQNHGANCTILHTLDAQDLDEANQVAVQTLGAVQASGDLLAGTGPNALGRLARGATTQILQTIGTNLQWTSYGTGESQSIGASNTDGTQTTPARSDHTHARNPGNTEYLAVATGGLTGAVATTRFVGGTASGAPVTGTFALGDFVIDQTGIIWICTVAGTSGTWVPVNGVPINGSAVVATSEATPSSTYTDLTTPGPSVTLVTGTTVKVTLTMNANNSAANAASVASFAISGATTQAAFDALSLVITSPNANNVFQESAVYPVTGLTPGSNTFKMRYRALSGGIAAFSQRNIIVERLN